MHSEFVSESPYLVSAARLGAPFPHTAGCQMSLLALRPVAGCLLSQGYRQSRRIRLRTVLIEKLSYIPFHIVTGRVKEPF